MALLLIRCTLTIDHSFRTINDPMGETTEFEEKPLETLSGILFLSSITTALPTVRDHRKVSARQQN